MPSALTDQSIPDFTLASLELLRVKPGVLSKSYSGCYPMKPRMKPFFNYESVCALVSYLIPRSLTLAAKVSLTAITYWNPST